MEAYRNGIVICALFFLLILFTEGKTRAQKGEIPSRGCAEITEKYLGQRPPGESAELFAFDILSSGAQEGRIVFSPDGSELLYDASIPAGRHIPERKGLFGYTFTLYSSLEQGVWTEPVEFLHDCGYRIEYPFFSPDGNRIYFNSLGPGVESPTKSASYLWYIERIRDKWSKPEEINFGKDYSGNGAIYPSVSDNGNLYFAQCPDGIHCCLYISRFENGNYTLPEKLNQTINDQGGNHPYIAPDESFIIFDSERTGDTFGSNDLYISFRDTLGAWMKPINLGEGINTCYDERRPFLSYDGRYLFFVSDRIDSDLLNPPLSIAELRNLAASGVNGNRHIYWADASFIEIIRAKCEDK